MGGVEEVLQKLVPNPTNEDTADMMSIALTFARIAGRRAARLQAKLTEANERIKALIASADDGASAPVAEIED